MAFQAKGRPSVKAKKFVVGGKLRPQWLLLWQNLGPHDAAIKGGRPPRPAARGCRRSILFLLYSLRNIGTAIELCLLQRKT
jgi:hypothetical protein